MRKISWSGQAQAAGCEAGVSPGSRPQALLPLSRPEALKVILVCFERQLGSQWYWLSLQVKEMALRKVGGLALWDFLDFIVRTRIPIFVLLRPFIQCKVRGPLGPQCQAQGRGRTLGSQGCCGKAPGTCFGQLTQSVNFMLHEDAAPSYNRVIRFHTGSTFMVIRVCKLSSLPLFVTSSP